VSDEKARRKAREAMMTGDTVAMKQDAINEARRGAGLTGFMSEFIDKWIYLEGSRMNYRGVLVDVFSGPDGQPSGLVLNPCIRVGEWGDVPNPTYEERFPGPHVISWAAVIQVGAQPIAWPTA
jgi:hypothetical protein